MFGPHLTLDLSECDRRKLSDLSHIYDLLDELPDVIGMHKITPPYTFIYRPGDNPSEWGVSGFVIIAESHIVFTPSRTETQPSSTSSAANSSIFTRLSTTSSPSWTLTRLTRNSPGEERNT